MGNTYAIRNLDRRDGFEASDLGKPTSCGPARASLDAARVLCALLFPDGRWHGQRVE